jgi:hypothetical protein
MVESSELAYAVCDCWVHCIFRYQPVGRCGRCGVRPEGNFVSRKEGFDYFYTMHGHAPEPMTEL